MQDNTFYIPENQQLAFDEQQKKKISKANGSSFSEKVNSDQKTEKIHGPNKKEMAIKVQNLQLRNIHVS